MEALQLDPATSAELLQSHADSDAESMAGSSLASQQQHFVMARTLSADHATQMQRQVFAAKAEATTVCAQLARIEAQFKQSEAEKLLLKQQLSNVELERDRLQREVSILKQLSRRQSCEYTADVFDVDMPAEELTSCARQQHKQQQQQAPMTMPAWWYKTSN